MRPSARSQDRTVDSSAAGPDEGGEPCRLVRPLARPRRRAASERAGPGDQVVVARAPGGEHRDDPTGLVRAEQPGAVQQRAGQPRLDGQQCQPAAPVRDPLVGVERAEPLEEPDRPVGPVLRQRLGQGHPGAPRGAPAGQREDRARQVGDPHLRERLRGHARPVVGGEAAHRRAGPQPGRPPGPLLGARPRLAHRHQARHAAARVEAGLARQARVDDRPHPRDGKARLGHRGGDDDARPAAPGQHGVLLAGRLRARQARRLEPARRDASDHLGHVAPRGDEDEHRTAGAAGGLGRDAGQVRGELARQVPAVGGEDAAGRRRVDDLEVEERAGHVDDPRVRAEQPGPGRRVEGGRHDDQRQVGAQLGDVAGHGEGQVGVQVPLVHLVEDDRADAGQVGVAQQAVDEDAGRHELDARAGGRSASRRAR